MDANEREERAANELLSLATHRFLTMGEDKQAATVAALWLALEKAADGLSKDALRRMVFGEEIDIEAERDRFERDATPMGFDLERQDLPIPEPWSEYVDAETGHRWGGWLARAAICNGKSQ